METAKVRRARYGNGCSQFAIRLARARRRRESETSWHCETTETHHAIIAQKTSRPTGLPQAAHVRAGAGGGRCRPYRDLSAVLRRTSPLAPLRAADVPAASTLSRRADQLFRARTAHCAASAPARGAKRGDRGWSAAHPAGDAYRMDRAPQRAQADCLLGVWLSAGKLLARMSAPRMNDHRDRGVGD